MIKAFCILYILIFLIVFLIKFVYWCIKAEGEFDIATETCFSFVWPEIIFKIIINIL